MTWCVGVVWDKTVELNLYATSFVDMAGFKFPYLQLALHLDMMIINLS